MHTELTDEAVVIVKRAAEENRATCVRVKLIENAREAEVKGGTC
jgi:hypothetical protein